MTGKTVDFATGENFEGVGTLKDIESLVRRLDGGQVGVVFLSRVDAMAGLGGKLDPRQPLSKAKLRVAFASFMTEIPELCDIVLPVSDPLETWGDVEPRYGTLSVIQPIIEPLHNTLSEGDILLQFMAHYRGTTAESYQQRLFRGWKSRFGERNTEKLLADGYLATAGREAGVTLDRNAVASHLRSVRLTDRTAKPMLVMTPSIRFYDGRSRNDILLNELPDPITTVTYGGWLSVSLAMAKSTRIDDREELKVDVGGWSASLPVRQQPGLPSDVVTAQYGSLDSAPVDVEPRSGELIAVFEGASLARTRRSMEIPILAGSQSQEGRGVIPDAHHGEEGHHDLSATLYPEKTYKDYRWAMAIDLDLCTGCNACAAACYVENNVPVVGPKLHLQGREMSWMRIEPFYDDHTEEARFQPMLCQHCTNAPCETVCPVYATYHNEDGLNAQIYNRCVGTRYCLNNCPYKVRRFNWFDWDRPGNGGTTRNPEVSMRGRGVMEKCTFCVQRIRKARDHAKDEGRKIQDGEVVTACQQACPTEAITFGNIMDERSEVHKKSKSDRVHRVFESLGTQP
ncbi:MAG: 4Fe-4S dicluster domain-containing protein, partial [Gammaproteobacteria bacterium]